MKNVPPSLTVWHHIAVALRTCRDSPLRPLSSLSLGGCVRVMPGMETKTVLCACVCARPRIRPVLDPFTRSTVIIGVACMAVRTMQ